MADPVRARRLAKNEGRKHLRITHRGKHESIRVRRATIITASAAGTPLTSIDRLLAKLSRPFTQWSVRKLAEHPTHNPARRTPIGRERLRQILRGNGISFHRTRTWRTPLTRTSTPDSTGSSTSRPDSCAGVSPSTSSRRCRSARTTGPARHHARDPTGCPRPTPVRTASTWSAANPADHANAPHGVR
jgi:hypothetical protein